MSHIAESVWFTRKNPHISVAYLLLSCVGVVASALIRLGGGSWALWLAAAVALVGLYLMPGMLSCVWKAFCRRPRGLAAIGSDSRRYFPVVFVTGIYVFLAYLLFVWVPSHLYCRLFCGDTPWRAYSRQFDARFVSWLLGCVLAIAFAYVIPTIIVLDRRRGAVLNEAVSFMKGHLRESRPLIALVVISYVVQGIGAAWISALQNGGSAHWVVAAGQQVVTSYLGLLVFLTAGQILTES